MARNFVHVFKAGHLVSYSCVCDVCREWVNEVGFSLNFPVWLVHYAHVLYHNSVAATRAASVSKQEYLHVLNTQGVVD